MGACRAKGEWSLFSRSLSLSIYIYILSLSPLYTVLPIVHRALSEAAGKSENLPPEHVRNLILGHAGLQARNFEKDYFTEMCSGFEAGSCLRLIDFVYHSTLGLRVIKKQKKLAPEHVRDLLLGHAGTGVPRLQENAPPLGLS